MNKEKLNKKYNIIKKLLYNIGKDHISEFSAQSSYYTILSFIPFFILLITLIQYTNIEPQTLFDVISRVVPDTMNDFVLGIVQEIYSKSLGTISVSIIITIWSAGKGLFALTKGLQSIYHNNDTEHTSYIYLRIKALLETLVFIILIITSLVLLVFGNSLIKIVKNYFGGFANYNIIDKIITKVSLIFIIFIIFLLIYKFIPKHKVTFKSQILGAAIGSILLNIISLVFSNYLSIFKGFSITYGSLSTLLLIMMWIYACFYTVFLGAEINKLANRNI